jgi:hypothetical protein
MDTWTFWQHQSLMFIQTKFLLKVYELLEPPNRQYFFRKSSFDIVMCRVKSRIKDNEHRTTLSSK